MTDPQFFVDRSLGRRQVPDLLRADGWDLVTLAEHYGIPADEHVADVEWLRLAGQHGWLVLMKDGRIRYRPAEPAALLDYGVRAFCLTSGNLTGRHMAMLFIQHRSAVWNNTIGPAAALYSLSQTPCSRLTSTDDAQIRGQPPTLRQEARLRPAAPAYG